MLEQLALGRSNEEIARRLFISVNTVKFHLHEIYDRLGVHNRVEAAAVLASRRGQVRRPHLIGWAGLPPGDGRQPSTQAIPRAVRAA